MKKKNFKPSKQVTKPVGGTLSAQLTELLVEAQSLVRLKGDWKGMPDGPVRDKVMQQIDAWFKGDETMDDESRSHRVSIDMKTVQELWEGSSNHRSLLREGLEPSVIQELNDGILQDKSSYGESDYSIPDDDDIPF